MIPGFEPIAVLTTVAEHRVTDLGLVSTMWQLLVDHPRMAEFDLSSVRGAVYGASPMPDALLERVTAALLAVRFTQTYGMTTG